MPSVIKVDQIQSDTGNVAVTGNVNIDSGLVFVDAVNNRVGIGTASPDSGILLDVRGNMRLGDGVTVEQDIYFYGTSGNQWQLGTNNTGASSSNRFYIWKDGVGYCLAVDNAGRVTLPYQPAFAAALTRSSSTNYAAATNQTIVFDDASTNDLFNQGGHYSTSTGRFTAPIDGIYLFSFSSNMTGGGAWRNVQLRINGTLRRQNYEQADTSWDFMGWTHVVQLSANDYVTCFINNESSTVSIDANAFGSNEQWTFFNGYLLG